MKKELTTFIKTFRNLPTSLILLVIAPFVVFPVIILVSSIEVSENRKSQIKLKNDAILENRLHEMRYLVADISSSQTTFSMKQRLQYFSPESLTSVRRSYLNSLISIKRIIGEIEDKSYLLDEKEKLDSLKNDLQEFELTDDEILNLYNSELKENVTQADFLVLGQSVELANRMSNKMEDLTQVVKTKMVDSYNKNLELIFYLNITKYLIALIDLFLVGFAIYHLFLLLNKERSYQKSFLQMQKMEVVGRLSGGIAHDFNNLLTVIIGQSDLLSGEINEESKQHKRVRQILKAGKKAADLTNHLLLFSKKQSIRLEILDANVIINDYKEILQRLIGEDVTMKFNLVAKNAFINTNTTQLQQVLMNLVINAKDAMPDGGKIMIETSNIIINDTKSTSNGLLGKGNFIMIAVSDTGDGMDDETKSNMFEPFYTTKGKGTGLGLATVFSIVSQMNGKVNVYSELGFGTSFKFYFSQISNVSNEIINKPISPLPNRIISSTETVLVVEDDKDVREFTAQALMKYGYKVITAKDAMEALKIFTENSDSIKLVISDVIMPEINGAQLAKQILELKPKTNFLFMSGYTDGAIKNFSHIEKNIPFIQKPFTSTALAEMVRKITI